PRFLLVLGIVSVLGGATLPQSTAQPTGQATPAEIGQLIEQLGSEVFSEREAASARLGVLGEAALPALRRALQHPDAEVRRRADDLVHEIERRYYGELRALLGHTKAVVSIAATADGRRLLSGANDQSLRLWDLESGKEVRHFDGQTGEVWAVAFSPD